MWLRITSVLYACIGGNTTILWGEKDGGKIRVVFRWWGKFYPAASHFQAIFNSDFWRTWKFDCVHFTFRDMSHKAWVEAQPKKEPEAWLS